MTKSTKWPVRPAKTQITLGIFAVLLKKHCSLNYLLRAQWRLIRLGGCPGWSESSLAGVHVPFSWFCHEATLILSDVVSRQLLAVHAHFAQPDDVIKWTELVPRATSGLFGSNWNYKEIIFSVFSFSFLFSCILSNTGVCQTQGLVRVSVK